MMKYIAGLAVMVLSFAAGPALSAEARQTLGVWRNPQNSVHVRAEPCGRNMCGTVIWANEKAKRDAARGSNKPLIGSRLFQDFTPEKEGVWKGKVYVPDIGKTFSGTVSAIDETHMKGEGCLLGGIACKSQIWTRISK